MKTKIWDEFSCKNDQYKAKCPYCRQTLKNYSCQKIDSELDEYLQENHQNSYQERKQKLIQIHQYRIESFQVDIEVGYRMSQKGSNTISTCFVRLPSSQQNYKVEDIISKITISNNKTNSQMAEI